MGLRGAQTRMYGGLWEFAPAGGVDVPAPGVSLDDALLEAVMRQELEEEVGLDGRLLESITPRLVAFNREACSYDIALFAEIKDGIDALRDHAAHRTWEYERVEWVPIEHLDGARGACPPDALPRPMVPQDEPMRAELVRLWRAESGAAP
jgi:8-oxo-dGTP pyrophosphatase MutT (NUDIX family)